MPAGIYMGYHLRHRTGRAQYAAQCAEVMTRQIITCSPDAGILDMLRLLELHKISAMPVVENGQARGMVSADVLAKKSLAKLLQTQSD